MFCQQALSDKSPSGTLQEVESFEEVGVEVNRGNRIAVAEPGVELESEKDKDDGERELDWTTTFESDVWDDIAKVDKLVE